MGRKPCCGKGVIRGAWSAEEDEILVNYIKIHGEGKWTDLPPRAGLRRCGKSCRLRWLNYLRPDIKRGNITEDEDDLIIRLHKLLGNRWTLIAGRLPGRTDNEIKNYWNTNLSKRVEGHDNTLKSSQQLIKPTQNQEIHRPTKHKVISPVAVRLTGSKVLPALHHYVNVNDTHHSINDKATFFNPSSDDDHSHKSSNFLMDFDIGDFLSPHQQKEINSDFDDDNCYAVHTNDMTGDMNFPSLPIETCKSTGKGTETNFRAVAEPSQDNDWDLDAMASFLCLEDVLIC